MSQLRSATWEPMPFIGALSRRVFNPTMVHVVRNPAPLTANAFRQNQTKQNIVKLDCNSFYELLWFPFLLYCQDTNIYSLSQKLTDILVIYSKLVVQ